MMDPRWIVPLTANLLLIVMNRELNHYLAPASISVMLAGLMLPTSALRLSTAPGLLAMALTGFAIDSLGPTVFGSTAILLTGGLLVLRAIRHRLARETLATHLAVALLANLALFVATPFFTGAEMGFSTPTVFRIFFDLLISQVVLLLLAWWFFALQERALILLGVNMSEEMRQQR